METLDWKETYAKEPPPFGHPLKPYFLMDPEFINLNNGSFGSTPKPVLHAVHKLNLKIEANPDLFHRSSFQPLLEDTRRQLAELLNADRDEVVLVSNTSTGINTVLRNFRWEAGDVIFVFTTAYISIARTVRYISDTPPHPTLVLIPLNFPTTSQAVLATFEETLVANSPVCQPNKNNKRVVVIDGIISNPGIFLPWREMVKICKRHGVWSIVDGAHSIGQEPTIDLRAADPDFWISNCHKWLSSKRSCAVLYVPFRNQHVIRSPISTSYAYLSPGEGDGSTNFVQQFEWSGTIDFAPYLTVPDALAFRRWLGGETKINAYCHDLALKGGKVLASILGTEEMDPQGEFTLNMVNVKLPLPSNLKYTLELDVRIKDLLFLSHNASSAYFYHNDAWWTRCSAQIWNEIEDFEKMGRIWIHVCDEVKHGLGIEDT